VDEATAATQDAVPGRRGGFFELRDGLYAPTEVQRSPWDPRAQNGVGIGGLLMHLAEQAPTPVPMQAVHMVFDILGQTPFKPVEGHWTITRAGKRMQMVETTLVSDGRVTARGRVLRVRLAEGPVLHPEPLPSPAPEGLAEIPISKRLPAFSAAMETRLGPPELQGQGFGCIWSRMRMDLVDGTPTSPLVHAAMLSDFGGGISNPVDRKRWISPNLYISTHLSRAPVGPWLMLQSSTVLAGEGTGLVNMLLGDRDGAFGRAHQTLFIAPHEGAG
jgi:hypothetical protein